jgi:hypothetical protein
MAKTRSNIMKISNLKSAAVLVVVLSIVPIFSAFSDEQGTNQVPSSPSLAAYNMGMSNFPVFSKHFQNEWVRLLADEVMKNPNVRNYCELPVLKNIVYESDLRRHALRTSATRESAEFYATKVLQEAIPVCEKNIPKGGEVAFLNCLDVKFYAAIEPIASDALADVKTPLKDYNTSYKKDLDQELYALIRQIDILHNQYLSKIKEINLIDSLKTKLDSILMELSEEQFIYKIMDKEKTDCEIQEIFPLVKEKEEKSY